MEAGEQQATTAPDGLLPTHPQHPHAGHWQAMHCTALRHSHNSPRPGAVRIWGHPGGRDLGRRGWRTSPPRAAPARRPPPRATARPSCLTLFLDCSARVMPTRGARELVLGLCPSCARPGAVRCREAPGAATALVAIGRGGDGGGEARGRGPAKPSAAWGAAGDGPEASAAPRGGCAPVRPRYDAGAIPKIARPEAHKYWSLGSTPPDALSH